MQNKTKQISVLLGLVLGALALVAPVVMPFHAPVAFAQESVDYPDVPENHWAYVALDKLVQVGLIEPMSNCIGITCKPLLRYEFAVAVARILDKVGALPNGVQCVPGKVCMPELSETISDASGFVKRPELIDAISALRIEFRPELQALGVRVDYIDKRVAPVLDKPPILTITPRMQINGRAADDISAGNDGKTMPKNQGSSK